LMPFKPDRVLDTLHKQHSTVMHVVALNRHWLRVIDTVCKWCSMFQTLEGR
jgi:hypothetical protein